MGPRITTALFFIFLIVCVTGQAQDKRALKLADAVMESMGGAENWEKTRYLQWTFFGSRKWWWDKWTGNVRMESQRDDLRIAMNIHDKTGKVFRMGKEEASPDSLNHFLDRGYRMWINDSYWLVMPFKLRDPGTSLSYLGRDTTTTGQPAEVLELTFADVGVTPDNKYHIYVDPDQKLVVQWNYFRNYTDPEPRFRSAWTNYRRYGQILLSDGRGDRSLADLAVYDHLPAALFERVDQPAGQIIE
ncbi:MAG: hypothetical protein R3301_06540 [Saprospiraceae bacterium]|nr:hypothetical protein [Saprospiraceae bacterium]